MRMFWNPADGEPVTIGDDEEVPEGFLDHHPDDMEKGGAAAPPEVEQEVPLTHEELVTALQNSGTSFNEEADDAALTKQLVGLLHKALKARKVTFAKTDGPRALLAMLQESLQSGK